MEKTKHIKTRKAPLRSAVIILIIAVVVVFGIECYREWMNYERTASYQRLNYLVYVFIPIYEFTNAEATPKDLQALIDDTGLIPPPNPYRRDRRTVFTTIDKRIPGAVWYIPGPIEAPYDLANGMFLPDRFSGPDFITEGDNPWIIGWGLSKPDGVKDGILHGLVFEMNCYGDSPPVKNPSWLWRRMWKNGFPWKYADGETVDFASERYRSLISDYCERHPENFAAEKRPRMPKGFTISTKDPRSDYLSNSVRAYYTKLYGYDLVVSDEKAKK